jgi:hypothetical protein
LKAPRARKPTLFRYDSNSIVANKAIKLTATKLRLLAREAQGEDVADRIAEEQTRLQNNIRQDEEEVGLPSTFLSFDATTDYS